MPDGDKPRILRSATYLLVPDVAAAGAYYQRVFGFREEYRAGAPPIFAIYSRDGAPVMFRYTAEPDRICPIEKQGGAWDLFMWTDSLDRLFAEVLSAGATIVYPPVVQPYGMREFAVRDPNGYVLGFGESVAPASA